MLLIMSAFYFPTSSQSRRKDDIVSRIKLRLCGYANSWKLAWTKFQLNTYTYDLQEGENMLRMQNAA